MARLILTRDNKILKTRFLTGIRMWVRCGPGCNDRSDADAETRNQVDADVIHLDDDILLVNESVPASADTGTAGR